MYPNLLKKTQIRYLTQLVKYNQLRPLSDVTIGRFAHFNARNHKQQLETVKCCRSFTNNCSTKAATSGEFEKTSSILKRSSSANPEALEDVDAEHSFKSLLYEPTDKLILKLNRCRDYIELLDTIEKYEDVLELKHRIQAIILLWMQCHTAGMEIFIEVLPHPVLLRLLTALRPQVAEMNINELACSYLYLRKIGVPNRHILMQELLLRALDMVKQSPSTNPLPLPALSRLIVGINTGHDFYVPMVCSPFVCQLETHASACTTDIDARLIAICLLNIPHLYSLDQLEVFKQRLQVLLATGTLNAETPKAITKLLHMLNMAIWSQHNVQLMRQLMLVLRPSLTKLSEIELKTVCRIFQYQIEPAGLTEPLMHATAQQIQKQVTPDVLTCYLPFAEPHNRGKLVDSFKNLLFKKESWLLPNASANFFILLRRLKISDMRICDTYWDGVLAELNSSIEVNTHLQFLRHCHRYMHFNNNLGGTYRHNKLEQQLSGMAMRAIDSDVTGRLPSKFAQLAGFVLAYGHTPFEKKKFPNIILSKIITMAEQFDIIDCFQINRGIQIATELRFRHHMSPILSMQLATIDNVLIGCIERHLNSQDSPKIADLNVIARIFNARKSLRNSVVYHKAFNKYKEIDFTELNSRLGREMAFNFMSSSFFIPKALDAMFSYVEENHEHIMGDTVEKILSCAYQLGYMPQSLEVLDHAATVLLRDFNFMSGLSLVQACLALCFYKTIPDELINKVFCVNFIKRVEEEIQECYSKATYPERVQNLIMQLNRTVCLDFPEANVPWFQQNYLEAHLSRKPAIPTKFSGEIRTLLETMLKDETYLRCNHITPYGYQIDFVIHFDRDKKLIPSPVETTMLDRITKVAILLLKLDSFCENDLTSLKGPETLRIKHLEMMGYKVLHINEHDWNSKYMNAPGAKANYLKCLLKISN